MVVGGGGGGSGAACWRYRLTVAVPPSSRLSASKSISQRMMLSVLLFGPVLVRWRDICRLAARSMDV